MRLPLNILKLIVVLFVAGFSLETRWKLSLAEYSLVLRADNLFDADVRNHLSRLKSVMPEKGRNFSAFGKVQF